MIFSFLKLLFYIYLKLNLNYKKERMNWIKEHDKKCPTPVENVNKKNENSKDKDNHNLKKNAHKNLIYHHFNMNYINDPFSKKKEITVEEEIKILKKEKSDINFKIIKLEKHCNKYKSNNIEIEKEIEKLKKKINKDKSYIEIQLKEIKRLEEIISLNNEKN